VLCKNWYLLGEKKKHFKPCPQKRILLPVGGSFQISNKQPCLFYMGSPLGVLPVLTGIKLEYEL